MRFWVPQHEDIVCNTLPLACALEVLVAQSSATGVTVAAIPPCSAIRFQNPKAPRYPPPACRAPCLLRMRGKCDRGFRRKVRHLALGGCSAILARHLWFCGNFDATLYARHCVARLGSPHGCATKLEVRCPHRRGVSQRCLRDTTRNKAKQKSVRYPLCDSEEAVGVPLEGHSCLE